MKFSWFQYTDCTTEQADHLMSHYSAQGIKAERSLNQDLLTWTVSARLPVDGRPERTPKSMIQRVWG